MYIPPHMFVKSMHALISTLGSNMCVLPHMVCIIACEQTVHSVNSCVLKQSLQRLA